MYNERKKTPPLFVLYYIILSYTYYTFKIAINTIVVFSTNPAKTLNQTV